MCRRYIEATTGLREEEFKRRTGALSSSFSYFFCVAHLTFQSPLLEVSYLWLSTVCVPRSPQLRVIRPSPLCCSFVCGSSVQDNNIVAETEGAPAMAAPLVVGSGGSVGSQVLTLVGDLAGEARRQPGGLHRQRVGPMMGDTPYGVVARRTRLSSVASLSGKGDPRDSRVRTERYDGHYYICLRRRLGAPKWVPGW